MKSLLNVPLKQRTQGCFWLWLQLVVSLKPSIKQHSNTVTVGGMFNTFHKTTFTDGGHLCIRYHSQGPKEEGDFEPVFGTQVPENDYVWDSRHLEQCKLWL